MGWSGSDILYIINEEMLSPKGKPVNRRATGACSGSMSGLSDFYVEEQTGLTILEYARGIHRSSTKGSC
jgi:hypothetical protein